MTEFTRCSYCGELVELEHMVQCDCFCVLCNKQECEDGHRGERQILQVETFEKGKGFSSKVVAVTDHEYWTTYDRPGLIGVWKTADGEKDDDWDSWD